MLSRRGLITGLSALVAAPAVIRTPGLLMPVRNIVAVPDAFPWIESSISVTYTETAVKALLENRKYLEAALMANNPLFARLAALAA